jgi:uncharacterized protein YebE (UPF0316 family)
MFGLTGIWVYVIIFCGKLTEVCFSNLRIMFVAKGKKILAMLFGIVEISIWTVLAGTVLTSLQDDPLKAVIYCVAFALGIPVGIWIEEKLAMGLHSVQIIADSEHGEALACSLREQGFGLTILTGHSVDQTPRVVVVVQFRRKKKSELLKFVREACPNAIIAVNEVKTVVGGFIK